MDPIVLFSKSRYKEILAKHKNVKETQMQALLYCLNKGESTLFGRDHGFKKIKTYEEYRKAVPVRSYQAFTRDYWCKIFEGQQNVCWPGKLFGFVHTAGTMSGNTPSVIPISYEGLKGIRYGAMHAGLFYMAEKEKNYLFSGKQVIIGGDWLGKEHSSGHRVYKISGITPSITPFFIRNNLIIPSKTTANMQDFEAKMNRLVEEAVHSRVTQVSSIPIWLINFFERVGKYCHLKPEQTLKDVWPDLQMCIYTGASIRSYRSTFDRWLGPQVCTWEIYGASEGVVAVKESRHRDDLLVIPDNKTFFEFIPMDQYGKPDASRVPLWEVETNKEYAVILTNNHGLFSYDLGDTVVFTTLNPYRLRVSGRINFYLNTVGEHMTQSAIELALITAQEKTKQQIAEFTVGPAEINPGQKPFHHWIIEFSSQVSDYAYFSDVLDKELQLVNSDYKWYRSVDALGKLAIDVPPAGTFKKWVKVYKNNDPQTKIPMVRNDRELIDQLIGLASANGNPGVLDNMISDKFYPESREATVSHS